MNFIWKRQQCSPQADVSQPHYANFLKMFAAAIAVGVVFSAAAATLALMLARTSTANASTNAIEASSDRDSGSGGGLKILNSDIISPAWQAEFAVAAGDDDSKFNESNSLQPAPGNLFVTDGCGGVPLVATERDFQVTIKGDIAEVQVMQTFVIESNDGNATEHATFHAVLPRGAQYSSFRVQTSQHDLIGQYANDTNWDTNNPAEVRQLRSQGMVRVFESRQAPSANMLSSDTLMDLHHDETVVVSYRYQIPIEQKDGKEGFSVALADPIYNDDEADYAQPGTIIAAAKTAVSVWVVWVNPAANTGASASVGINTTTAPKKILAAPPGVMFEHRGGHVEGASWASPIVQAGDKFQLSWLL